MEINMTIDQIAGDALDKIVTLYWSVCDEKKAAVDPSELTQFEWVEDLLDEQYEIALMIESDPDGWDFGRQKF